MRGIWGESGYTGAPCLGQLLLAGGDAGALGFFGFYFLRKKDTCRTVDAGDSIPRRTLSTALFINLADERADLFDERRVTDFFFTYHDF
jgi:hypothetical protein